MGFMNHYMLGTDIFSVLLDPKKDVNLTTSGSAVYYNGDDIDEYFEEGELSKNFFFKDNWKVPNMLYCPENIFANKIAALDVNFIHPNSYTDGYGNEATSAASRIAPTISSWYKAFRNIAVVGLLCVLVYLGIRILIETSAQGKAKYKESLKDWFIALCLIFTMHLIMAGTLMMIEKVTELISESVENEIHVQVGGNKQTHTGGLKFKTNITGYIRLKAESDKWQEASGYTIIYLALVIYTGIFTFMYLKRFLYMAFLTMISPLVALTYPMDKAGDGKAQAFNMWFKEFLMHAILQPVHLLLYTALVSSAIELARENMIYALVAIGFLIPAEKLIKKMFRLDQGTTTSGFGSFAGGALTMSALSSLAKKPATSGKEGKIGDEKGATNANRIHQQDRKTLGSFGGGNNDVGSDNGLFSTNNEDKGNDAEQQEGILGSNNNPITDGANNNEGIENGNNYLGSSNGTIRNPYGNMSDEQLLGLEGGAPAEDIPIRFRDAMGEMGNDIKNSKLGTWAGEKYNNAAEKYNNLADSVKYNLNETKAGRTAKALGKTAIKGIKKEFTGEKGKRKLKFIGRSLSRGIGAAAGASIGLAAGLTTGDASKAFQMAGAGLAAGSSIGKNTFNTADKGIGAVASGVNNFRSSYEDEKYGLAEADKKQADRQNKKARKAFMQNEEEQAKYRQLAINMERDTGKSYDVNQLMNAAFDYKVAGIDESKIAKGLELEDKYGGIGGNNHEQMMDVMDLANSYGKDYIMDDKKRVSMEGLVQSKISDASQQRQAMQLFAEAHGLGDFYKQRSSLGNQAKQAQPKPQPKPKYDRTTDTGEEP